MRRTAYAACTMQMSAKVVGTRVTYLVVRETWIVLNIPCSNLDLIYNFCLGYMQISCVNENSLIGCCIKYNLTA